MAITPSLLQAIEICHQACPPSISMCFSQGLARMYLQTPLPLPEFFPIGQWNRFKAEVRHLTDPLALKLVRNGTKVPLMGSLMGFVMGL